MKAILLDTLNQEVKSIDFETAPNSMDIAKALGENVKYIECVGVLENGDRVYASENPIAEGFECHIISRYLQGKIINSALIIGASEDGDFKDPLLSLEEAKENFFFSLA